MFDTQELRAGGPADIAGPAPLQLPASAPQPMHVVSRVRIASSVAIRSSSSAAQLRESRSQSRFVGFWSGSVSSAARIRSSGIPAAFPACTSAMRRSVTLG